MQIASLENLEIAFPKRLSM